MAAPALFFPGSHGPPWEPIRDSRGSKMVRLKTAMRLLKTNMHSHGGPWERGFKVKIGGIPYSKLHVERSMFDVHSLFSGSYGPRECI